MILCVRIDFVAYNIDCWPSNYAYNTICTHNMYAMWQILGEFTDFSNDCPVTRPLLYAIIRGLTGGNKIKIIGYKILKKLSKFDHFENKNYAHNPLT